MKLHSKTLLVLAAGAVLALGSCNTDNSSSSSASSPEASSSAAASSAEQSSSAQEISSSAEEISSEPQVITYSVNVLESNLVDLSVNKNEAEEGETITITATPKSPKVVIDAILVNGVALEDGARTFQMPAENVTVGVQAHEKLDITIVPFEGIEISADKQYADEGEVVTITANYDKEAIELEGFMAGDITLGENEDGTFYFVMPNHAVSVSPIAYNGVVRTINCLSDHAYIDVFLAREGDSVNFHVATDPGYDVVNVTINGENLAPEADGSYLFVMPGEVVIIGVEVEAGQFEIECEDPFVKDITFQHVHEDGTEKWDHSDDPSGYFFAVGSMIRVELRDNDNFRTLGILLSDASGETQIAREADSAFVYFEMPAHKISLGTIKEELLHEFAVDAENASHLNFTFYRKDEDGNYIPTTGASIYETTYLKVEVAEGEDPEHYQVRALSLSFKYYTYAEDELMPRTINLLATSSWSFGLNEDGYYSFKLCVSTGEHMLVSGLDSMVTLTAIEKDMQAYAGSEWIGSYRGVNIYGNGRTATSFSDSYAMTIDSSGDILRGTASYAVITDDEAGHLTIVDPKDLTKEAPMLYGEKTALLNYNTTGYDTFFPTSSTGIDVLAYVKVADGTVGADYTVQATSFKVDDIEQYLIVAFYYQGAPYSGVYIDVANEEIHMDVMVENIAGEGILAPGSTYSIIEDGEAIAGFGISGGSYLKLDGYQGEYAVEGTEDMMVLNGMGVAQYDDAEWSYVVGDEGLVMTTTRLTDLGGVETTMLVTIDEGVATIVSSEDGDPIPYMIDLETHTSPVSSTNKKGWKVTEEGNYEPLNSGVHSSCSEMTFTALTRGNLSFDYQCSSEGISYDYFSVYKNGNVILGRIGGSTLVSDSFSIELAAGESIQFVYVKDSMSNGGIDKAILSNLQFEPIINDGFDGEYTLDDNTKIVVGGFGVATYGGREISYIAPESGDELVITYEGMRLIEGGAIKTITTFTLDRSTKTGTVVTVDDGEPFYSVVDLETNVVSVAYSDNRKGWVAKDDGTYEPLNSGIDSSCAEMTITALAKGTLSFDYQCSTEGARWDYFAVYKDGVKVLDNVGGSTLVNGSFSIDLLEGESVQLVYAKDSGSAGGIDKAIVSNVNFEPAVLDGFEGEYTLNDDSKIVLDGYGVATCNGKSFSYVAPESGDELVIAYEEIRQLEGGATKFLVTYTLDRSTMTGTVSTEDEGAIPFEIDLTARDVVVQNRPTAYGWTDQGDGSYRSDNHSKHNTTAQMSVNCYEAGTLSFHYQTSGDWTSSGGWDYFAIYKNGVLVVKYGDTSGDYSIDVEAGDVIQFVYSKDPSSDGGSAELDGAIVSNIVFTPTVG